MNLLEVTEVSLEWSDLDNLCYHKRPDLIRSPGVHVSDVLREIAILKNMYTVEDREDEMPLRILLGLAFEESAARLYKDMHWQPGEVAHDGLSGSPDGITPIELPARHVIPFVNTVEYWQTLENGPITVMTVDEFKYTGKSQRIPGRKIPAGQQATIGDLKDISSEWLWMQQGMAYINLLRCMKIGYEQLDLCRFHICWKYGAYVFPMREVYMRYLVQFTEPELRGNWAMMKAFGGGGLI